LNLFKFESLNPSQPTSAAAGSAAAPAASASASSAPLKDGTKQIGGVLKKLAATASSSSSASASASSSSSSSSDAAAEADEEKADTQLFAALDREQPTLTPAQTDELKVKQLFAGLVFYLAREVSPHSFGCVVLCIHILFSF
jgi:hypothetical protein